MADETKKTVTLEDYVLNSSIITNDRPLYDVVYKVTKSGGEFKGLEKFYDERYDIESTLFTRDWSFDKDDNLVVSFNEFSIKEITSFDTLSTIWETRYASGQTDLNIYKFNNSLPFTLIIFSSADDDSVLCKDIIVRQYIDGYSRDVEHWQTNGVVIYDVITGESVHPTYEINYSIKAGEVTTTGSFVGHMFNPSMLAETDIDEVFLCGYCIDKNLLRSFSVNNEKLFIFENNPYKINEVRSLLRTSYSNQTGMNKTKTKALQAFTLFRDPIGNITSKDNKGLKVLKAYSDAVCLNFDKLMRGNSEEFDNWETLEKVKYTFEKKISPEFFAQLVDALFNKETDVEFELEDVEDNELFDELVIKNPILWTGNVLALNTDEIPTANQINKYINEGVNGKRYSKIVTFKKNDNNFWTVKAYMANREITGEIDVNKAPNVDNNLSPIRYYTENGTMVIKVVTYNTSGEPVSVQWFNISGKKNVPVNTYVESKSGEYAFRFTASVDKGVGYDENYNESEKASYLKDIHGNVKKYSRVKDGFYFDKVYTSNEEIEFNKFSLIRFMSNKYYCTGNKYIVEAAMTDKQLYECLKTKSLV